MGYLNYNNSIGWLFVISGVVLVLVLMFLAIFGYGYDFDKDIGEGIYYNGTHNIECHTVKVEHNNFLGTYDYEKVCRVLNESDASLGDGK